MWGIPSVHPEAAEYFRGKSSLRQLSILSGCLNLNLHTVLRFVKVLSSGGP